MASLYLLLRILVFLIQNFYSWYQILEPLYHGPFYAIHIMKAWTLIYDVTMTSWVQTLISYLWHHSDIIDKDRYRYMLLANGLYPSYCLSGLCISLYRTAHTCTNSTEQYIRLALQPVSIMNYLVLIPSSSQLWDHSHYSQAILYHNQDYLLLVSLLLGTSIPSCSCTMRSSMILLSPLHDITHMSMIMKM